MNRMLNIDPATQFVVIRFRGTTDTEDILRWMDETMRNEAFSKSYDGIVDVRHAQFQEPPVEMAHLLADYMIEHAFTNGDWAVLVGEAATTAHPQGQTETAAIRIFSSLADAGNFLRRDLECLELD